MPQSGYQREPDADPQSACEDKTSVLRNWVDDPQQECCPQNGTDRRNLQVAFVEGWYGKKPCDPERPG